VTTRFRIDALRLDTVEGPVEFDFPSDLTVLAGPTGVGKTSLFELVKFGLGGRARLAPVVRQSVDQISIDLQIGAARYRIARSVDPGKRRQVRVIDLVSQDPMPDLMVDGEGATLSSLLMAALGLPDDMRAAARGRSSTREGARITFNDVFTFLYVPQSEINRDIAFSQEDYREPKRRAVFELLFGLTDPDLLAMRSQLNALNGRIGEVEHEHQIVLNFLTQTGTTGRIEAEVAMSNAAIKEERAQAAQASLRATVDPVTDRETQVLRDLLNEAEQRVAATRATYNQLQRQQELLEAERRRVEGDLQRLRRMTEAGSRLANIEFSVCPRCMQTLNRRQVSPSQCRVCLQDDPVGAAVDSTYEIRQLTEQLEEFADQLVVITAQVQQTHAAIANQDELVAAISRDLDARLAGRISPYLQAFNDAVDQLASAKAERQALEHALQQWDRADDIGAQVETLRVEREALRASISRAQAALDERRRSVIDELSEHFQETVRTLGIPGVTSAHISEKNYLPILNGEVFYESSAGGGIITATQVAYWSSLLTIALRRRDTRYPAFLLVDSPRLALNTAEDLAARLYRRLVTQADANKGQLQLIIADNELPAAYRSSYAEIDFTYDHPTVYTVEHPGPAHVQTIEDTEEEE
jgi:hypothetical protein